MRVVQVVGSFIPARCGVAHYTARLSRELTAVGLDLAIASHPAGTTPPVTLLPLRSPRWSLATLLDLLVIARRWRADWLHLQYAPSSYQHRREVALLPLVARLAPARPRIAVTVHEYGGWPLQAPRAFGPLAERSLSALARLGWLDREALTLLNLSDRVIVTNPSHLKLVGESASCPAARVEMIPLGPNVGPEVCPYPTRAAARSALGVPEGCFVVAFFGFVHPVKGIETLLRAMRRVRAAHPEAVLWIIGGVQSLALRGGEADAYAAKIRWMIDNLGLDTKVDLTGYLPDPEIASRLRAADLAVLPFNHGITLKSGALITCLSFRLPVLATGGGDLAGLRHGDNIWLVPPRDPVALADAIGHLARDPALRARIGEAGQQSASDGAFSWPAIARRHVELYRA